jgi:hypothetical protein
LALEKDAVGLATTRVHDIAHPLECVEITTLGAKAGVVEAVSPSNGFVTVTDTDGGKVENG